MNPALVTSGEDAELPKLPHEMTEQNHGLLAGRSVVVKTTEDSEENRASWSMLSGDERASMMLEAGLGFALISALPAIGFGVLTCVLFKIDQGTPTSREDGSWSPPVLAIAITITALFSAIFSASVGCGIYGAAHKCRTRLSERDVEAGLPEVIMYNLAESDDSN